MPSVTLRPALASDARMIFEWRNAPFIVARSSSQCAVEWNEHVAWMGSILRDDDSLMFIIERLGEPIGQARFSRISSDACVISIYLVESSTGKGYGVDSIDSACAEVFARWNVSQVIACVRATNRAGHSAFAKAGFARSETESCPADHFSFVLQRTPVSDETRRATT